MSLVSAQKVPFIIPVVWVCGSGIINAIHDPVAGVCRSSKINAIYNIGSGSGSVTIQAVYNLGSGSLLFFRNK